METVLTARERYLVRESYPLIQQIATPVSLLFYGRLFDLDPSLRSLFRIDMTEQSKKLMTMLDQIVDSIDDLERVIPVLRELGRRHVTYGVKPEHYETLCSALVWAFGQALESGFDAEVRKAWINVIRTINHQMMLGAEESSGAAV